MATEVILVAYKTVLGVTPAELKELTPKFEAPSNYKDEDKIKAYIAAKQEEFAKNAANAPYTGKIEAIKFYHVELGEPGALLPKTKGKADENSVARRFAMTLLNWSNRARTLSGPDSGVVPHFVGFDIRTFVKMLGVECAIADFATDKALSPWLWADSRAHSDIMRWLVPDKFNLTLDTALKSYGFTKGKNGWSNDEVEDWEGPGLDVDKDLRMLSHLAARLGFLARSNKPLGVEGD